VFLALFPARTQNPYIQKYTTANGLPSNNVYRVFQDSRKFIWMATDAGVARYDGTNFKYYTSKDGLNTSEVIHIQEDSQGRIWLFNFNGTFNYYYKGRIYSGKNTPFLDSLQSPYVFRKMFEGKDKTLYFYDNSFGDIYILKNNNLVYKEKIPTWFSGYDINNKPLYHRSLRYLKILNNEFYYFSSGGLFKSKGLGETPQSVYESFYTARVFSKNDSELLADVYQKAPRKLVLYKFRDFKIVDTLFTPERTEDELINDVIQDSDGHYWISMNSRLYYLKGGKLTFQINGPIFQNIIQDHEKNIWVSSLGDGVYKISSYLNKHFHLSNENFANKGIKCTNNSKFDGVWASNGQRLFFVKQKLVYDSGINFDHGNLTQIEELNNNTVVLGQPNFFIRKFKNTSLKKGLVKHPTLETGKHLIKFFTVNSKKDRVLAFYPTEIIEFQQNQSLDDKQVNKFTFERFYATYYNAKDQIFVNGKRIYKFLKGELTPYKPLEKFNGKIIRQHINLIDQLELFNIGGDSLYLFNGHQIFSLSTAFNPSLEQQIKYVTFKNPYLFFATNAQIYFCSLPATFDKSSRIELKNLELSFNNIHHLLIAKNELIVSSDDGMSFIPLRHLINNLSSAPIPYFRSILINEKPSSLVLKQTILKGKNKFQFNLGNIRFNSSKVQYAYILEGLDKNWNTGSEHNINYQNLRPGNYTFKFKVKLPSSDWSNELSYNIQIRPTLVQHPVFYLIGSFFIFILLFWYFNQLQKAMLKKQATENQILLLEQKALQLMMNPHFIFNALASIQSYILKNKATDAGNYLAQFARLIRQNLNATKTSLIDLEEEIERLRNYLELEQLRMNYRFNFEIIKDRSIDDELLIPTMILQPIVENAVWHGLADVDSDGQIIIEFIPLGDQKLKIIIQDNGIGVEQASKQKSHKKNHLKIGMDITRKRLEILGKKMNIKTSIIVSEAFPGNPRPGTKVEIIVPVSFDKSVI